MYNVLAYKVADNIDIELFQADYTAKLISSSHFELFYEVDTKVYVSVFKYGVVCFLNFDDKRLSECIKLIAQYCIYFFDSELIKEYQIEPGSEELEFGFKTIRIVDNNVKTLKLIMLNVAQSVALDYYFKHAKVQLGKTSKYTSSLEKTGTISLSDKELKKFIGKTHNLKDQIVENLHLLESYSSSSVGQNDYLIEVDNGIKKSLYMYERTGNIHEELKIIKEHLDYFNDIVTQGANMKLEWIIIILLAAFVVDIFFKRFF